MIIYCLACTVPVCQLCLMHSSGLGTRANSPLMLLVVWLSWLSSMRLDRTKWNWMNFSLNTLKYQWLFEDASHVCLHQVTRGKSGAKKRKLAAKIEACLLQVENQWDWIEWQEPQREISKSTPTLVCSKLNQMVVFHASLSCFHVQKLENSELRAA